MNRFYTSFAAIISMPLLLAASGGSSPLDVAFVIDDSGSMRTNDPSGLMRHAVQGLSDALPVGSRVAVVAFADQASLLMPLSPTVPGDGTLAKSLGKINYSGKRTDIGAGVERGLYELRRAERPEVERIMVLVTDGVIDLGDSQRDLERNRWLREDLARAAVDGRVRIFGVAFTEGADFELIQSLAQGTHGRYYRVLLASGLGPALSAIVDEALKPAPTAPAGAAGVPGPRPVPQVATPRPAPFLSRWLAILAACVLSVWALVAFRGRLRSPRFALVDISGVVGGRERAFSGQVLRFGRAPDNQVMIDKDTVSAHHAEIVWREGLFFLRDLKSRNGTALNNTRFSDLQAMQEVPLKHGDRIRVDAYEFEFRVPNGASLPLTRLANGSPSAGRGPGTEPVPDAPENSSGLPSDNADFGGDPRRGSPTLVKPEKCPNHKGLPANEICRGCGAVFCKYCVSGDQPLCGPCGVKGGGN